MINFEKTLFIWFYFEQIQFANKFTQIPQILLNYHLSFSLFFPQIFFSHKSLVVRYYFFNITQKIELTQIKSKSEAIHKRPPAKAWIFRPLLASLFNVVQI